MDIILLDVSGTLTDITTSMVSFSSGTVTATLSDTRFLYIGSRYPFNSKYFKLSTPNLAASTLTYEYWDGNVWRGFAYKQDDSSSSTVAFAQSGEVRLTPSKDYSWCMDDSKDIPELSSVEVYDLYWIRVKANTSITVGFQYIGRLFASHDDVKSEYPDLGRSEFLTAYQSGKTSWDEQIEVASRLVVDELIKKNIINSGNQLLDSSKLRLACVSKTAEIVYSALGDDHIDQVTKARNEFKERIHNGLFVVDSNGNGKIEPEEARTRVGRLRR